LNKKCDIAIIKYLEIDDGSQNVKIGNVKIGIKWKEDVEWLSANTMCVPL